MTKKLIERNRVLSQKSTLSGVQRYSALIEEFYELTHVTILGDAFADANHTLEEMCDVLNICVDILQHNNPSFIPEFKLNNYHTRDFQECLFMLIYNFPNYRQTLDKDEMMSFLTIVYSLATHPELINKTDATFDEMFSKKLDKWEKVYLS